MQKDQEAMYGILNVAMSAFSMATILYFRHKLMAYSEAHGLQHCAHSGFIAFTAIHCTVVILVLFLLPAEKHCRGSLRRLRFTYMIHTHCYLSPKDPVDHHGRRAGRRAELEGHHIPWHSRLDCMYCFLEFT